MNNLEKSFIERRDISGDVLKNIGINIVDNSGNYISFDNITWEIAKVFFKIGLGNNKNCLIFRYITDSMVGKRDSNQLCKIIIDKIEELKWNNPSFYY